MEKTRKYNLYMIIRLKFYSFLRTDTTKNPKNDVFN